jgi:uncharacterized integral membrane protein
MQEKAIAQKKARRVWGAILLILMLVLVAILLV